MRELLAGDETVVLLIGDGPDGFALLRALRQLSAYGLDVVAANHEFSSGQFEINLWHSDALSADAEPWAKAGVMIRDGAGPHGLGETALPPVPAAIGNALASLGLELTELPMTAERVLEAV